jgi:hypothetical protein
MPTTEKKTFAVFFFLNLKPTAFTLLGTFGVILRERNEMIKEQSGCTPVKKNEFATTFPYKICFTFRFDGDVQHEFGQKVG